ncbi:MAG: carbamate kinase [Solirubrobacterales bacterium]
MRIVVALGGNALIKRAEVADAGTQQENVNLAATELARIAEGHELVITHGNGPQVGLLALQNAAYEGVAPYPLDVLDAESEGMVGYMLELAIRNELPGRELVTVLTEVVVDADDPAFDAPSKPIGPVYRRPEAERLAAERSWAIGPRGQGFQRLVPSPEPRAIVELRALRRLIGDGVLLVCAGGGGIPVTIDGAGAIEGVEAVVDKDLTASLLARRLEADLFLMLTDVDAVHLGWGGPDDTVLSETTPAELRNHSFEAGSMAPKVEAACRFVETTGARAAIGDLRDAPAIVRGEAGTQIAAPRA